MTKEKSPIRETDAEARALAGQLISCARFASLAVLEPETGHPFASRAAIATDIDRTPIILISTLSTHTAGLQQDPRASLLLGEPGKGDPLAHPRVTLQCIANRIERDGEVGARVRDRFLNRNPKSALYADFQDFSFFRLEIQSASLNGGFGKAYHLTPEDILIRSAANEKLAEIEASAIAHMNDDHPDTVSLYAKSLAGSDVDGWRMCGVDAAGFELSRPGRILRIDFDRLLEDEGDLMAAMMQLAKNAREAD